MRRKVYIVLFAKSDGELELHITDKPALVKERNVAIPMTFYMADYVSVDVGKRICSFVPENSSLGG